MMKSRALAGLIGVVAFLAGMKVQDLRKRDPGAADEAKSGPAQGASRSARRAAGETEADQLRTATGEGVAAAVKPVLRVGTPEERLRRFLALLDGVNAENWQALLSTMASETRDFGRFQPQEWDMALRRAGMVDGKRAADIYGAGTDMDSLRKILAGWAQTDLEGAWKWMAAYKDDAGRRDIWRGVLIGLAELNPSEAMARLDSLPFEVKGGTISFLIGPMVQAEGIDNTAARIKEIYADYKAKDPSTISAKEHEFVYAFFHNVCDIKRNAGYTPEKRMEALELLAEFPDLAMRSPWLIPRTVQAAARDNPQQAMEMVERMTVTDGQLLDSEGVDTAAKVWLEKDPAGFAAWVQAHRGSPVADQAATHLVTGGG